MSFLLFFSITKLMMQRVYKFWLWNDWIFKLSDCGRKFYESIDVIINFADKVCIFKYKN